MTIENEIKRSHLIMPILDRIDELNEKIQVLDEISEGYKDEIIILQQMVKDIRERYPTRNVRNCFKII
jgi:cell division septum initiation protein DivIVA